MLKLSHYPAYMIAQLQILFCAILWGFAGPLIRWSALPALSVMAIRFTLPLFLAYAWLRWVENGRLHSIGRQLALASVLTAVGNVLYISAFSFTSISNVLLLLYTRPVIATTLACIVLGERVSSRLWVLLAVSFFGAILIVSAHDLGTENRDVIGMLLALGAAITSAFTWAIIKKHGYGQRSASELVFYQNLFGAIIAFPLLPMTLYNEPMIGISFVLIYAVLIGFIGTLIYFQGLRHTPLARAMPLTYAELVVALIIGIFVFGDPLPWQSLLGGFLIVLSSLGTLLTRSSRKGTVSNSAQEFP